ncbi:serine protease 27 [Amia ocellicauda]|uniref:serine protease 27 n=1 Tax=Amia ocellicauda TaxID=2972642 RepID=UPI003463FC3C
MPWTLEMTLTLLLFTLGLWTCEAQGCGQPPLNNRIVGGQNAPEGAWPWNVDIQQQGVGHVCGGSLIDNSWVLSAAHCFPSSVDSSIYILYLGRYQLNGINSNEVSRRVQQVVVYPGYMEPQQGSDVALVQLDSPVEYTDFILPVCLPDPSVLFSDTMDCYVTGWGQTTQGGSLANIIQEVQLPIISLSTCQQMYQTPVAGYDTMSILSDMICAGFQDGGKDACQGDSGGPLVCSMVNNTWVQAGVVSFGEGCAIANRPGVYARVTSFSSWVQSYLTDITLVGRAAPTAFAQPAIVILAHGLASALIATLLR